MDQSHNRFFIALLPPKEAQEYANRVKRHFSEVYNSRAAQKSPPHVTLQPPFEWEVENLPILEQNLEEFAKVRESVPMVLSGFSAFPPRVIFIDVERTPELLKMQQELMAHMEQSLGIFDKTSRERHFNPHLTVAFRDLNRKNFRLAWEEYKDQKPYFEFTVTQLTLLVHNGKRWEVGKEFPFLDE